MAAKVFQTGLLTDSGAGDIGWSRVPLGALHGDKGAAALRQAGVAVHLADTVTAVRPAVEGPHGGTSPSRFVVQASGGELTADGVVVALPHYRTEDVLPLGALPEHVHPSQLKSSPIVNVHVHFDRRVTDLRLAAALGTPAQWIFDRTGSSGAGRGSTWPCPSPAPTTTSAPVPRISDGRWSRPSLRFSPPLGRRRY